MPEQINNDVMLASQGIATDRSSRNFENGFSSPQQQAQMHHM